MLECWNGGVPTKSNGGMKIVFIEKGKKNYKNGLSEFQHSNISTFLNLDGNG